MIEELEEWRRKSLAFHRRIEGDFARENQVEVARASRARRRVVVVLWFAIVVGVLATMVALSN